MWVWLVCKAMAEVGGHDYETLTRDDDDEDGYAKLEELRVLDSFSYSGSFDDPTSLLDRHPYGNEAVPVPVPGGRPPMHLPFEAGDRSTPRLTLTPADHGGDLNEINVMFAQESEFCELDLVPDEFSSDSDDEPMIEPIGERRERAETNIDIIGSLCLQGVMQGLVPVREHRHSAKHVPDSIRMTKNLEEQHAALDEISVMVTRNLEIVPESPYNPNAGTERSKPFSTKTAPQSHMHSKVVLAARPRSESYMNKVEVRPTSVTYVDNIVRPQPLPPIDESLPDNERKRYRVIENLLESEAAFLSSLNIAIEIYKKPLKSDVHTELNKDDIKYLFGPISPILEHHELFFAAMSEQTKAWAPDKQIGDVFLASFNRKEVVKHYSRYVNNFAKAMSILEKAIKKKNRFYEFLKKQMSSSGSVLSLQALLLKPIQRFPQYLLFLHDLIKYTPALHPDSVVLEMAEAHMEGIASYLNEAKRRSEQLTIVQYLNTNIEKLQLNLLETDCALYRQDIIQWATFKDGKWTYKERHLLLFNNHIVCCSVKRTRNSVSCIIEADQVISGDAASSTPQLVYKWSCPLSLMELSDPDYMKETSPLVIGGSEAMNAELKEKYRELKEEMQKLNQDFELLYKIGGLIASLNNRYESLRVESIQNACRVLQRKLEESQELIRSCCEPSRVDITIPNSDGFRYHQILLFESKKVREDWIRDAQLAKLRQNPSNHQCWINDEEDVDDDEEDGDTEKVLPKESLPLVVDYMRLSHNTDSTTVECATSVGNNRVWFASGSSTAAYISVVRCFMPSPILLETFPVPSHRILSMKSVSTSSSLEDCSSLTVWIGAQCGTLMMYDASTNKCLQSVKLCSSVLCIEKYKNRAFVGTSKGKVYVYTRMKGTQWDLSKWKHQIPVSNGPIQCFCAADDKLWMGVGNSCFVWNMETLKLEFTLKVSQDDKVFVRTLEKAGAGIWVALSRGATLYLFHKDTKKPIQEINLRGSLSNIIGYAGIENKFDSLNNLHITSLLAESGYLWVGSSSGATLVYRIPPLNGLPLLNGRPFLASDGHIGTVRVLVGVQTKVDNSSARFDQFISDEKERMIGSYSNPESLPVAIEAPVSSSNKPVPVKLPAASEIDDSALPRVTQVIKKLELGKQLLQMPSTSLPVEPRPIPKPRTKKKNRLLAKANAANAANPVSESTTTSTPVSVSSDAIAITTSAGVSAPAVVSSTEACSIPAVGTPSDYETPRSSVKRVSIEEQHDYDEVPVEEDVALSGEEETEDKQKQDTLKSPSDIAITPSRYVLGENLLAGDSIYEHIGAATITMAIPGREAMPTSRSVFVFAGGSGLVDFRQPGQSLAQTPSGLTETFPGVSPGRQTNKEAYPCVITYQIPPH